MMNTFGYQPTIYTRDTLDCPVIADVDVVVVGGSQSGVAAAVSCARAFKMLGQERKILLVEQNTYLGGQGVATMTTQWKINAFRLNVGLWRLKGIGYEMVKRIVALGGSDRLWEDFMSLDSETVEFPFLGPDHDLTGEEALEIESIKFVLQEMCDEAGVEVLLDARAVAPIVAGNPPSDTSDSPASSLHELPGSEAPEPILNFAAGVIVEHAWGRGAILAKAVVDASANGLVSWWLGGTPGQEVDKDNFPGNMGNRGCRVRPPQNRGLSQSYVWIGGVDMATWTDWALAQMRPDPKDSDFEFYPNNPEQFKIHAETGRLVSIKSRKSAIGRPKEMWDLADEKEDLSCIMDSKWPFAGFYAKWIGPPGHGNFCLDGPYYRWESLDGSVWSEEHVLNTKGSMGIFRVMRHMPGWERSFILRMSDRMGLRTTRIPNGIYRITGEDYKTHAEQPDAVGVGNWHDVSKESDRGQPGKWCYHVPLRALISNCIDGLGFCGRAVSFDDGVMNAHRVIGTTLVCGQGIGVAVAVAVASNCQLRNVDHEKVREILVQQDVIFKIPSVE
ncbi:MAG TPA: FAD-dependent oxidoreductase [Candidatus Lokiarchaeia archaeon]|nr:FAD-dependent oxidoreductase [Candidatus Lokiarchaeia archaeon]